MTPFLELQLAYVALSLAMTGAIWFAVGPIPKARPSVLLRALATALVFGVLGGVAIVLIRVLDEPHSTYQFMVIAWWFYAAALWLPLIVFAALWRKKRASGSFEFATAALFSLSALCGVDALFIEPDRLQLVETHLEFPVWQRGVQPIRVVLVSDLQTIGPNSRDRRALEMINAQDPDIIVVAGDFIAGPFWNIGPAFDAGREFLSGLKAKLAIVAVKGHSERERDRERLFAGLPIRYLQNESFDIPLPDGRSITIHGTTALDPDVSKLDDRREPGRLKLVVSHVPDVSNDIQGKRVDLHLAGHTHGGQICIPGFGPPMTLSNLPREFARGLHTLGDHPIFVTPGIGMEGNHAPRIRFFCPPEIDVLVIGGSGDATAARSSADVK